MVLAGTWTTGGGEGVGLGCTFGGTAIGLGLVPFAGTGLDAFSGTGLGVMAAHHAVSTPAYLDAISGPD